MKLISHIIIFIYLLYIVTSSPECFDKNCLTCTDNNYGTCTSCATNFTLFYGSCVCYNPNCISCSSSRFGACVQCKPPFIYISGQCLCKIQFCMVCSETGCAQCQSGYALNSDKTQCVEDSSTIVTCADTNCDTCLNSLPGTCVYCKDGYFAEKGKCVALPCLTQDENGKCVTCPSDYLVVDGYCYPKCNGHSCTVQVGLFTKKCDNECLLCIFDQLYEHADCTPATY